MKTFAIIFTYLFNLEIVEFLSLMNRGYTREWYLNRIEAIRRIIPDCGISMDIISGFCTETEEDHKDTLSLMERKI